MTFTDPQACSGTFACRGETALFSVIMVFVARCLLVGIFLPFSALDKVLNHRQAVQQAKQGVDSDVLATVLILAGFTVEVVMSLAVLTGMADRLAALVLAAYCVITAVLWKQFWKVPGFRLKGADGHRDLFWDFLKNLALAGGFLMLASGATADGVQHLIDHPFASSHPYTLHVPVHRPSATEGVSP